MANLKKRKQKWGTCQQQFVGLTLTCFPGKEENRIFNVNCQPSLWQKLTSGRSESPFHWQREAKKPSKQNSFKLPVQLHLNNLLFIFFLRLFFLKLADMCVDKHALLHKMTCVFGKGKKIAKISPTLRIRELLSLLWGNTVSLDLS